MTNVFDFVDDNIVRDIFLMCPESVQSLAEISLRFMRIIYANPILGMIRMVGWNQRVAYHFAEHGNLEGLKYVKEHGGVISGNTLPVASRSGNLEVLKYVVENISLGETLWDPMPSVLQSGNMDCVRYLWNLLHDNKFGEFSIINCSIYATQSNNLECLKFVLSNGAELNVGCLQFPIKNENFDMFRYVVNRDNALEAFILTSTFGKLEFMKFVYEKFRTCNQDAIMVAIKNGHFNCALYAIEHGSPIPRDFKMWMDFMSSHGSSLSLM
jgi:hypothetical protein